MAKPFRAAGPMALLGAALIFGSGFVVMKDALNGFPVFLLLALRFSIGSAVLALAGCRRLRGLSLRTIRRGLICGTALGVGYIVQTYGLDGTTPGRNAFLTAVYCVLVPFVTWALGGGRPTGRHILAGGIALLGIGLISLDGQMRVSAGDALSALCGVIFAVQVALLGLWGREEDPLPFTLVQFLAAAGLSWIGALVTGERPASLSGHGWWLVLYLGLISTALALLLQNVGQRLTHPATAAILLSLESVFGVVFSILFYGETLTLRLAAGFAVVFCAVMLSVTSPAGEGRTP